MAVDGSELVRTHRELCEASLRVAHALQDRGVDEHSLVAVGLGNTELAVLAIYGAWWLGACALPLSHRLPNAELDQLLEAAAASGRELFVIGDVDTDRAAVIRSAELADEANRASAEPMTVKVPNPGRAIPSGGSTGRPKIITDDRPMVGVPGVESPVGSLFGQRAGQRVLILGPLYHTGPFSSVFGSLFSGGSIVLMERFDARLALQLVERHRVQRIWSVPAQLQRMARDPGVEDIDFGSVETLYHSGAACPPWLKRRWIEFVGAEHVFEGFGSTESVGALMIRGDEWLEHPGSVGRPQVTDVSIRDEQGNEVPVGEVGEIFMRWSGTNADSGGGYRYWGSAPARTDDEGFVSVGDLGWRDDEGYVYVADRRVDMIVTGGVNVFPAEVEVALTELPEVRDVAVVGVPDDEWGRRVHAIIETEGDP
ncbi:MAG: AMP-binding protein, partial [Microbacterium sp.]